MGHENELASRTLPSFFRLREWAPRNLRATGSSLAVFRARDMNCGLPTKTKLVPNISVYKDMLKVRQNLVVSRHL
jgi:hypothetical protein